MLTNTPKTLCSAIDTIVNDIRLMGGKLNSVTVRDIDGRTMPEVIAEFSISYGWARQDKKIIGTYDGYVGAWNYHLD
jgi:hypothetical protein